LLVCVFGIFGCVFCCIDMCLTVAFAICSGLVFVVLCVWYVYVCLCAHVVFIHNRECCFFWGRSFGLAYLVCVGGVRWFGIGLVIALGIGLV
jgi:hypothetical protein